MIGQLNLPFDPCPKCNPNGAHHKGMVWPPEQINDEDWARVCDSCGAVYPVPDPYEGEGRA